MLKILRVLPFFLIVSTANAEPPIESEVWLYGGTPAGVIAAAAAARQGVHGFACGHQCAHRRCRVAQSSGCRKFRRCVNASQR
jgi:hypothetical protein